MAITKTWEVNTCERDVSDGYITKVIYRLKATENSVEIDGTRMTGEVTFTKPSSLPSDFKAYHSKDAATDLEWVNLSFHGDLA